MAIARRALVTGASEGIGRNFCLRLAREGFEVLAVARTRGRLESLIGELSGAGHSILVADLATSEGQGRVRAALEVGSFDVLVNNAGFGLLGSFTSHPLEEWRRMVELNVWTVVDLSHAFLKQAKRGSILINVSSTLSFLPMPIQGVYSATKGFVTLFTEALWYEGRKKGIRVLNLCPGITATEFQIRSGGKEGELPAFLTQTPEEVVNTAWSAVVSGGGPTKISGWKNAVGAFFSRLLSRRLLTQIMGRARQ